MKLIDTFGRNINYRRLSVITDRQVSLLAIVSIRKMQDIDSRSPAATFPKTSPPKESSFSPYRSAPVRKSGEPFWK